MVNKFLWLIFLYHAHILKGVILIWEVLEVLNTEIWEKVNIIEHS